MAKAKLEDAFTPEPDPEPVVVHAPDPKPPAALAEDGAGPDDEQVWVRRLSGDVQRCYAKDAKGRQIRVEGTMFEHVGEGPDGAWLYEERAF